MKKKALLGFDGFVDEVVHVVKTRTSPGAYTRMETLKEYGAFISAGSDLSLNVEIVPIQRKVGGNGPIMADALNRLGYEITYVGCLGAGEIETVFKDFVSRCRAVTIAEPGRTDAMEFFDGKIISCKLESLNQVSWQDVLRNISAETLAAAANDAALIGFLNWSLLAKMNGFYEGFLEEVAPWIRNPAEKTVFFDLADPEKRTRDEILTALSQIGRFTEQGFDTVLGLNKKEACEIAELFGLLIEDYRSQELQGLTLYLAERLSVKTLVVHPVDRAGMVKDGVYTEEPGPYCERPVLTTGAGDNFNAGFVTAYCEGASASACLRLGNAASGFYVRNGYSGGMEEISSYI